MTDKIIKFPNSDKNRTVADAFSDAEKESFDEVLIIGQNKEYAVTFVNSKMTNERCLWILERARRLLMEENE